MLLPEIDPRKQQDIISDMKKLVPFYTPEWIFSPDNPDMGTTLFLLYAHMLYENIKKLNLVPLKNFAAFANLLNTKVAPSTPAQAFITFELSEGAREPVFVRKGNQVFAKDDAKDEQIIFETADNLLVTPSMPAWIYNVSSKLDRIISIPVKLPLRQEDGANIEIPLFDYSGGENIQEHSLFLANSDLLDIKAPTVIELELTNSVKHYKESDIAKILSDLNFVEWLYFSQSCWRRFDIVECEDNRVRLIKTGSDPIESNEFKGETNRWIKCRFKVMDDRTVPVSKEVELDGIGISVRHYEAAEDKGIVPDRVLFNDIQMDPAGFFPFGDVFNMYSAFYFSSREVLTKKNSQISVKFNLRFVENRMQGADNTPIDWKVIMKEEDFPKDTLNKVSVSNVAWEYWNGKSWLKLFNSREYEEIFFSGDEGPREILFDCPSDMAETSVNNENNYWIRARIVSIRNLLSLGMVYNSPYIENLTLNYDYEGKRYPLEGCTTYNNGEYSGGLRHLGGEGGMLKPFYCIDAKYPGFYICFDIPPLKGPIGMLLSIKPRLLMEEQFPAIKWEYLSKSEYGVQWKALRVMDGTNSLTESGTVVFAGPNDLGLCTLFGREGYWIRVLNPDSKYESNPSFYQLPVVDGIYMNTVAAIQQESMEGEMLQRTGGISRDEYILSRTPVVSEEVWVDETGSLSVSDMLSMERDKGIKVNVYKDSEGNPIKCWVKWHCVEDFSESDNHDRHYTIDRTTGAVSFGNGKNGMQQPSSGMNTIKANYKTGGGKRGNLAAGTINELQSPIGFIEKVYNPKASSGGCEKETVEEALKRSTEIIKHRNRAVTAEDFECLARQASRNIAMVKCLANFNEKAEKESGCITMVIVPKDERKSTVYFSRLKHQVEEYLSERASNIVSFKGKIKVIQPVFLEICVSAVLTVKDIDDIIPVEKEATERLNKFLDPFEGNYDGKGWRIGQNIHESIFYPLLKSIGSVKNVERISIAVFKADGFTKSEIRLNDIETIPHCLITDGSHSIIIKTT
ncbi:MAG TPA: baseplate J/gp47 family protein [Clostridia bacterium]|nr:baseplate J/gp47 family protein [Clostridia bacterium]